MNVTGHRPMRAEIRIGHERRWKPSARPVIIALLLLEAALAGSFAIWPPSDGRQTLDAAVAVVLTLAALGCLTFWRHRGPLALVEGSLLLAWGVPMIFIATRQLEASRMLWSTIEVLIAIAMALYLPSRNAAMQVAALVLVYLFISLTFGLPTHPLFLVSMIVCIVVCSFAIILLRQDRDRALRTVEALATTDSVTGLLNRRGLAAEAPIVRANAMRADRSTVIALIDVDGLKHINDTCGHDAGDRLIMSVAKHWRSALRQGDLIARIGGDEFALVLPQTNTDEAGRLLERIRDEAPGPWSYGWTVWAPDESLDAALERADALMYLDKQARKVGRSS